MLFGFKLITVSNSANLIVFLSKLVSTTASSPSPVTSIWLLSSPFNATDSTPVINNYMFSTRVQCMFATVMLLLNIELRYLKCLLPETRTTIFIALRRDLQSSNDNLITTFCCNIRKTKPRKKKNLLSHSRNS